VRLISFVSHTTKTFQILDVTLFGALKQPLGYKLPFEDKNETVKFIMNAYRDFKQIMVKHNRWVAFGAIGFEFNTDIKLYRLLFNEEKLMQSAGLLELWWIDVHLNQLSNRRKNARFGWIKKQEARMK
jgi:hypothetical protein